MAFPLKKKKEESTNEKIIRLHQEGKSVEEICAELEGLRNPMEIVTGVIQRKLGADAVPDAVVQHERNHAAEVIAATKAEEAPAAEAPAAAEEDLEGLSKLERYMLEKKRKQEAESAKAEPEAEYVPEPEPEPEPVNEPEFAKAPVVEPVQISDMEIPEPEVHKVSLVDEYLKQNNNVPNAMDNVPYTPFPGEEYAVMDAIVPPDVESADISDVPIATYTPPAEEESETAGETYAEEGGYDAYTGETAAAPAVEADSSNTNKVADKMKAFALSQIEANNAKIAELEAKKGSIDSEYASRLDDANNALVTSQMNYDVSETRLNEAYAEIEKARESHRLAIAKADDEYRRKLEEIEEQYRNATFEANAKFQEFDDRSKENIEKLDNEKNAAQEDLNAKRAAVAELRTTIEAESEKIGEQIKALEEENAGYQSFLG